MSQPDDLDLLLTSWGHRHRLPADRSEQIRRAIITGPAPTPASATRTALSPDWWLNFTEHMADLVVRASRPPVVVGR